MARLVKSWNFQVITENCQLHYSMWQLVDGKHQHRHYGTAFSREGVEFIPAEMIEVAASPKFTHPYQLPDIWVPKDDLLENFISIEPFPPGDNFRVFYIPIRITRPAHPKRSKLVRDPWCAFQFFEYPLVRWQSEVITKMHQKFGRFFKVTTETLPLINEVVFKLSLRQSRLSQGRTFLHGSHLEARKRGETAGEK